MHLQLLHSNLVGFVITFGFINIPIYIRYLISFDVIQLIRPFTTNDSDVMGA